MDMRDELGSISSGLKRAQGEWDRVKKEYSEIIRHLKKSCAEPFPSVKVDLVTDDVHSNIEIFGRVFYTQLTPFLKENELVGRCLLFQIKGKERETLATLDINARGVVYSPEGKQLFLGDGWGMEGTLTFLRPLNSALKEPVFTTSAPT